MEKIIQLLENTLLSVSNGDLESCKLLIDCVAGSDLSKDEYKTPLYFSVYNCLESTKLLLDAGYSLFIRDNFDHPVIISRSIEGNNPDIFEE